jgi:hypothetical protein
MSRDCAGDIAGIPFAALGCIFWFGPRYRTTICPGGSHQSLVRVVLSSFGSLRCHQRPIGINTPMLYGSFLWSLRTLSACWSEPAAGSVVYSSVFCCSSRNRDVNPYLMGAVINPSCLCNLDSSHVNISTARCPLLVFGKHSTKFFDIYRSHSIVHANFNI